MPVKIVKKPVHSSAQEKPKLSNRRTGKGHPARFDSIVKALGPEKISMVDARLLNGEPPLSIAKTIKMEWGLLPKMVLRSLANTLTIYRRERILTKLVHLADGKPPINAFAERVDVLENLTKLVELQQGRVSKGLHAEKIDPYLHRSLKFEMQLLGNLYEKLATLQMDLGLLRKVPAKLQIEGMASHTQKVLEDAMQRSRRVDEALTKAFSVLDGKFKVVAPDAVSKH